MVRCRSVQRTAYPFCKCQHRPCTPVPYPHTSILSRPLRTPPSSPSPFGFSLCFRLQWHAAEYQPAHRVADLFTKRSKLLLRLKAYGYRLQYLLGLAATGEAHVSNNCRSNSLKVACRPTRSQIDSVPTPTFRSLKTSHPFNSIHYWLYIFYEVVCSET